MKEPEYQIETSDYQCVCCEASIDPGHHYFSTVVFEEDLFRRRNYCVPCWRQTSPAGTSPPEAGTDGEGDSNVFAYWKTIRPRPPARAPHVRFDPHVVLIFFRRLAAAAEGENATPSAEAEGSAGRGSEHGEEDFDTTASDGLEPGSSAEPSESGQNEEEGPSQAIFENQKRELLFVLALLLVRKKLLIFESAVQRDGGEWLKLTEREDRSRIYWVENPELSDDELEKVRDSVGELLQMQI